MFAWHDRRSWNSDVLERCFTNSLDGVSEAPFSRLNLGRHVGDDAEHVEANRARVARALSVERIAWMDQVHGNDVAVLESLGQLDQLPPKVDAMVTALPDVALAVMVADCTPVLLQDTTAGVIGVAHAGRPGMLAGVVPAAIAAMRDLGAESIEAVLGPSVCGRCYEVPEQMRADAMAAVPVCGGVTRAGTPSIDVAAGVASQLADAQVPFTWVDGCTMEDPHLFSYRRDGQTGRFAGLIVRHSGAAESGIRHE